jgi:hypothetical protein
MTLNDDDDDDDDDDDAPLPLLKLPLCRRFPVGRDRLRLPTADDGADIDVVVVVVVVVCIQKRMRVCCCCCWFCVVSRGKKGRDGERDSVVDLIFDCVYTYKCANARGSNDDDDDDTFQ